MRNILLRNILLCIYSYKCIQIHTQVWKEQKDEGRKKERKKEGTPSIRPKNNIKMEAGLQKLTQCLSELAFRLYLSLVSSGLVTGQA